MYGRLRLVLFKVEPYTPVGFFLKIPNRRPSLGLKAVFSYHGLFWSTHATTTFPFVNMSLDMSSVITATLFIIATVTTSTVETATSAAVSKAFPATCPATPTATRMCGTLCVASICIPQVVATKIVPAPISIWDAPSKICVVNVVGVSSAGVDSVCVSSVCVDSVCVGVAIMLCWVVVFVPILALSILLNIYILNQFSIIFFLEIYEFVLKFNLYKPIHKLI